MTSPEQASHSTAMADENRHCGCQPDMRCAEFSDGDGNCGECGLDCLSVTHEGARAENQPPTT